MKTEHIALGLGAVGVGLFLLSRRDGGVSVKMPELGISLPSFDLGLPSFDILPDIDLSGLTEGLENLITKAGETVTTIIPTWVYDPVGYVGEAVGGAIGGATKTATNEITARLATIGKAVSDVGGSIAGLPGPKAVPTGGKVGITDVLGGIGQYAFSPVYTGVKMLGESAGIIGKEIYKRFVPGRPYTFTPIAEKLRQPIVNVIQGGAEGISRTTRALLEPMR